MAAHVATTSGDPNGIRASEIEAMVNAIVDEYRARCLWFLRPDYYPATLEERLRALGYIERHGDVAAFRRAAALRQWLSPRSKGTSVDS
jgi:hypothetical protein